MARLGIIPRKNLLTPFRINSYSLNLGDIIEFRYNPVSDGLPYYDPTPMVFYLGGDRKFMLGMNFHFIPIKYRKDLLDIILQVRIKLGASAADVQEIYENFPEITNVNIDKILFGDDVKTRRTITNKRGIDWTAFTHLSPNPAVRVMKMGLRVYKMLNMTEIKKVEYTNPKKGDINEDQLKVNNKILTDMSVIQGIESLDIRQASTLAVANENWSKFLRQRAR
jgi:hypothetical protein